MLTTKLSAIADAIRAKTGKADALTIDQMPGEIASIKSGGADSSSSDGIKFISISSGILPNVQKGIAIGSFSLAFESSAVGALQEE